LPFEFVKAHLEELLSKLERDRCSGSTRAAW
jgi:hypothetical protein